MTGLLFPALVLVTWVAIGLASVIFLGRRGRRSPAWWVIGAVLGPVLLPIALELGQRHGVLLSRADSPSAEEPAMTVLAAVDGSRESDEALHDAARVLAPKGARFVLLTVLDPDVGSNDPQAQLDARALLESRAGTLPEGSLPPAFEVTMGDPGQAILDRAAACHADLVVMGRRGQGFSERILGSVADYVVRRTSLPVLLGRAPALVR